MTETRELVDIKTDNITKFKNLYDKRKTFKRKFLEVEMPYTKLNFHCLGLMQS